MSQINDCKHEALTLAGFEGAVNEQELAWLQSQGATSNQLNDAWLQVAGSGAINEQVMAYMVLAGAVGNSFSDVQKDFWCRVMGGGIDTPIPANALTDDAGNYLITDSGDYITAD